MPVYFGKPLVGTQKPPPEFATRNIKLSKSDVTSAGYTGLPYIYSALYAAYIYFIAYFMKATIIRKKVHVSRYFAGNYLQMKMDSLIPWSFPDVVVGSLPHHDAEFTALAKELGGTIVSGQKTKVMSISNVDASVYNKLRESSLEEDTSCDQGRSNLEDFRGFLLVLRIVTAFLMTHQYPNQHDDILTREHKRIRLEMPDEMDVDGDEDIVGEKPDEELNDVHFELIRVAKPSPSNFPYFGLPNTVPHLPGILFPYFPGCIAPSHTVISSVIKTYFLSSLGDDEDECIETLRSVKKASSAWAMSSAGLELQHLIDGIRLAIEAGARLYVIREDEVYLGFALLGFGFSVATGDSRVVALSADRLQAEVLKMESRQSSTRTLLEMVRAHAASCGYSGEDQETIPDVETSLMSLRPLRAWILERPDILDEENGEAKIEIIQAMRKCFQSNAFFRVNVSTVGAAIVQILDNAYIDSNAPFFISDQVFSDTTRVHEIMAAFGSTAFSFIHAGGTDYLIPREGEKDTASEEVTISAGKGRTRKEKAMASLFVAMKPMRACVGDFNIVCAQRKIVMRRERAGAQRNVQISGDDRDRIWSTLKECFQSKDRDAVKKATSSAAVAKDNVEFHGQKKRKFRDDF